MTIERLATAERMLAEIARPQDAQKVIDFAEAARVYAREMRLGTSAVNHATVIKLRAERRLADVVDAGQQAGDIADNKGHNQYTGGRPESGQAPVATLPDLGVDRQRLAEARTIRDSFSDADLIAAAETATADDQTLSRQGLLKQAAAERRREQHAAMGEAPPPPAGRYRCLVIDPPWPMAKIERDVRLYQGDVLDYPVMSLDEIAALPIPDLADDGCHIYLWVTHKFLPAGLALFHGWGVAYQCVMTWRKNVGITPFSWMYDTEHVLFGRVGSLALERNGLRLSFDAPVTRHSQKPDVFYERVIQASPGPRLELFARSGRDGFAVWGNEVTPDVMAG